MKSTIFMIVIGACAVAFISGCASTQQFVALPNQTQSIEDSTKGRIYVFRQGLYGSGERTRVRDGSLKIGYIGPDSFLCWERPPGKTTVFADVYFRYADTIVEMPEELDIEAGKVYYLRAALPKKEQMFSFSDDTNQLDNLSRLGDAEGEGILKKSSPPPPAIPKAK